MSQKELKILILSKRQQKLLQGFLFGKSYSITDINGFLVEKVSLATLKRDVQILKNSGYIIQSGEKRGVTYTLSNYGLVHRPIDPKEYFSASEQERRGATRFNFELFDILKSQNLFTVEEISKLDNVTKSFQEKAIGTSDLIHRKEMERFVIELSWKSSKIEGNTYTLLDTERLIRDGILAEGKTKDEATMILNHKKAFNYILEMKQARKKITVREIENIHRLLVTDLGISHGTRFGAVGITGSSYIPLDVPSQIMEFLEKLVSVMDSKPDVYSKALLVVMGISYLQPFEDGNKRTARMVANACLLLENSAPLSYRNVDEVAYRAAMLVFYEQNSIEPFKTIFVEQYLFACANYNLAS